MSQEIQRCQNCLLPATFPGVKFNEKGICNHCQNFKGVENLDKKKQEYRKRFEDLVAEHKGKNSYDALMGYSGGKDSTYTLYLLKKEYGLNPLAVTFDNGFLPPQTIQNIHIVTDALGIDHILFKPRFDMMQKIFGESAKRNIYSAQTLTRASTICNSCMNIVKFGSLRMAIEKGIPFITFGWSPGQIPITSSIMKNNPKIIRMMQKAVFDPLHELVGDEIKPYFLEEEHFKGEDRFPYNISPLAFLEYDEEKIYAKVFAMGWKVPQDIDANTTNCLLNSFANIVHKDCYGYHPYVFEMAKLVREGHLTRDKALKKITEPENPNTVDLVRKKLNL
jgi:tRNA(Ile)-lysidine synthase TilS/MesJ